MKNSWQIVLLAGVILFFIAGCTSPASMWSYGPDIEIQATNVSFSLSGSDTQVVFRLYDEDYGIVLYLTSGVQPILSGARVGAIKATPTSSEIKLISQSPVKIYRMVDTEMFTVSYTTSKTHNDAPSIATFSYKER